MTILRVLTVVWHALALIAIVALTVTAPQEAARLLPPELAPTNAEMIALLPLSAMLNAILVAVVWLPGWIILMPGKTAAPSRGGRKEPHL